MEVLPKLRVCAVFPHPDDECLAAGAFLSFAKEKGAETNIICATNQENPQRIKELKSACDLLKIDKLYFLDWPDGQLKNLDRLKAKEKLLKLMESIGADIWISYGPDGAYGHCDHIWLSQLLTEIIMEKKNSKLNLFHAAFNKGFFNKVYKKLKNIPGLIDSMLKPEDLGVNAKDFDLIIEDTKHLELKIRALSMHKSQFKDGKVENFMGGITKGLKHYEAFVHVTKPNKILIEF